MKQFIDVFKNTCFALFFVKGATMTIPAQNRKPELNLIFNIIYREVYLKEHSITLPISTFPFNF